MEGERERRKELKLGNASAIKFVGGERRDYDSSTISSWRLIEASNISHKSKRSTCKTPSHLPIDLSNPIKTHAKDKKSIPISKSTCKL